MLCFVQVCFGAPVAYQPRAAHRWRSRSAGGSRRQRATVSDASRRLHVRHAGVPAGNLQELRQERVARRHQDGAEDDRPAEQEDGVPNHRQSDQGGEFPRRC